MIGRVGLCARLGLAGRVVWRGSGNDGEMEDLQWDVLARWS
jgi:hypothetical protein